MVTSLYQHINPQKQKIFAPKTFHVFQQHIKIGDSKKSLVNIKNWGREVQNPFSWGGGYILASLPSENLRMQSDSFRVYVNPGFS